MGNQTSAERALRQELCDHYEYVKQERQVVRPYDITFIIYGPTTQTSSLLLSCGPGQFIVSCPPARWIFTAISAVPFKIETTRGFVYELRKTCQAIEVREGQ